MRNFTIQGHHLITLNDITYDIREQDVVPANKIPKPKEVKLESSVGEGDKEYTLRRYKDGSHIIYTPDGRAKYHNKHLRKNTPPNPPNPKIESDLEKKFKLLTEKMDKFHARREG